MQPRGYQLSTINQRLTRPSSRLHPRMLSGIGLGKSYPVTAAQLLPVYTGFLAPIHFLLARKELVPELAACASALKIYLSPLTSVPASSPNLLVTGGAGFIGSNLTLTLQEKFPDTRLTVIDDFRSGAFKNLRGYRGDFVAQNLATLDWREQFGDEKFDAILHLASITDTTLHDQFVQVHDNVESFRRLLNFARPNKTRIIYASSASTYGPATVASVETNGAAPANIYAFSKAMMDNLAIREAKENPSSIIVGLRYFNVYGPREAHKGVPASMVYHLAQQ